MFINSSKYIIIIINNNLIKLRISKMCICINNFTNIVETINNKKLLLLITLKKYLKIVVIIDNNKWENSNNSLFKSINCYNKSLLTGTIIQ